MSRHTDQTILDRADIDQTISEDEGTPMSKDELNVLQYVGGYVPHSLLKMYEKRTGTKYEQFGTCLRNMAVLSEHDNNILEYTKEWVEKVNRGGLFPLNNTFLFFVSIERRVRNNLSRNRTSSNQQFQEEIIMKYNGTGCCFVRI